MAGDMAIPRYKRYVANKGNLGSVWELELQLGLGLRLRLRLRFRPRPGMEHHLDGSDDNDAARIFTKNNPGAKAEPSRHRQPLG